MHRWTYDLKGTLLGAPHFEEQPCVKLDSTPLANWHGLLFDGPRDIASELAGIGVANDFDFSGYMLDRVEIHECQYNWKSFIEVYLEDYHVGPFHPGLGQFVTTDNLRWQFAERAGGLSASTTLAKPGTGLRALARSCSSITRAAGIGATWVMVYDPRE